MKVETAVLSPIHGVVKEISAKLNQAVVEKQLLMVLEEVPPEERKRSRSRSKNSKKAR
jgi:multidrug efflux pump subunit AcrA (membrane-fusion protein)